jgi:hypothetical protein
MGENEPKKKNFFETAAGLITGITALLVAITGLITVLNNSGCFKLTTASVTPQQNQTRTDSNILITSSEGQSKTNKKPNDTGRVLKTQKSKVKPPSVDSPKIILVDPFPPKQKTFVQWSENEEIKMEVKSISRYIDVQTKKSPITLNLHGNIIYPEHSVSSDLPEKKIVLKVYINDATSDAWNITSQNIQGENFYKIKKDITIDKPEDNQIKIEIMFFLEDKPFTSAANGYSNPIIQKGFKIEISD